MWAIYIHISKDQRGTEFPDDGMIYTQSIPHTKVNLAYIEINYDLLSIKGDHISVMCDMKYQTSIHHPKIVQLSWDDVWSK